MIEVILKCAGVQEAKELADHINRLTDITIYAAQTYTQDGVPRASVVVKENK